MGSGAASGTTSGCAAVRAFGIRVAISAAARTNRLHTNSARWYPEACAQLLELPIDWAEGQFRQMGRRDARDLAVALMASYQGIALLTNTFRDPELMARESRRLERWIDSLA